MHEIRHLTFPKAKSKNAIQKACDAIAIRDGEYHRPLERIRFYDKPICKTYEEAQTFIDEHDREWYDHLAVMYKENTISKTGRHTHKTMWLVKIEYHV